VLVVVGARTEDDRERGRLVDGLDRWREKARSLAADKKRLVAELEASKARAVDLEGQLIAATEKIATLSKVCFGTSSEKKGKKKSEPGGAGRDASGEPADPGQPPGDGRRRRGQRPRSTGHGRRDYSAPETEEVLHDLPEHERHCPGCGTAYEPLDEESSSQVDWQVRIVGALHRRRSYRKAWRCKTKSIVVAPVLAKPVPKGLFTSQFLARLIFETTSLPGRSSGSSPRYEPKGPRSQMAAAHQPVRHSPGPSRRLCQRRTSPPGPTWHRAQRRERAVLLLRAGAQRRGPGEDRRTCRDTPDPSGYRRRALRRARLAPPRREEKGHVGACRTVAHGARRADRSAAASERQRQRQRQRQHRPSPGTTGPQLPLAAPSALEALGDVELVVVQAKAASRRWRELIASHHYLGYTPLAGAQLRYLIESRSGALGALGPAASAWSCAPRDAHIGWDAETPKARLHLVAGNARFVILPEVRVPNLASHVLSRAARRLRADWQTAYGYAPLLIETFVETGRFTGASYKPANWTYVGRTKGRGKLDRTNEHALSVKDIYLYPLHRDYRAILTSPT